MAISAFWLISPMVAAALPECGPSLVSLHDFSQQTAGILSTLATELSASDRAQLMHIHKRFLQELQHDHNQPDWKMGEKIQIAGKTFVRQQYLGKGWESDSVFLVKDAKTKEQFAAKTFKKGYDGKNALFQLALLQKLHGVRVISPIAFDPTSNTAVFPYILGLPMDFIMESPHVSLELKAKCSSLYRQFELAHPTTALQKKNTLLDLETGVFIVIDGF